MEHEEEQKPRGLPEHLRKIVQEVREKIRADNERLRAERNARRWKAERDPVEYERQKERQRQEYAEARGGSVRPYSKIEATTVTEHQEKALIRDAARQKKRYDAMSKAKRQEKADRTADEAWVRRRREKGMSEEEIMSALHARILEREAKRADTELQQDATMKDDPRYGIF